MRIMELWKGKICDCEDKKTKHSTMRPSLQLLSAHPMIGPRTKTAGKKTCLDSL